MNLSGILMLQIWASMSENLSSVLANNKGTDQPAHTCSLIRAFVIPSFESIISKLTTSEFSFFKLVSVVEGTGLSLTLQETVNPGFIASRPICISALFLKIKYLLNIF